LLAATIVVAAAPPLEIGDRRQLFIDERFFAVAQGVTLQPHAPQKTGERNLVPDRPWEDSLQAGTVIKRDGMYHLWYVAMEKLFERADDFEGVRIAYARSRDGIRWEKPDLGLVEFRGSRRNNIILGYGAGGVPGGINGAMVSHHPAAPPAERFMLVSRSESVGTGLHLFTSPDGIQWRLQQRSAVTWRGDQAHLDTKNVVFWDERLQRYVAYVRKNQRIGGNPAVTGVKASWNPARGPRIRAVARAEADSLSGFPRVEDMPVVLAADATDPGYFDRRVERSIPYYDFYTAEVVKYPWAQDAYFMFPSGYYHYHPEVHREFAAEYPRNAGVLDVRFAASRDGIQWERYDREAFIPLGMKGEFDSKRAYMGYGIVPGADERELYMYYLGTDQTHGWARDERNNRTLTAAGLQPTEDIRVMSRVILRRDGFVSARGAYAGGEFTTPTLRFEGSELVLNVDTAAGGEVRVEVRDAEGVPLPGFHLEESDRIHSTNAINRRVSWRGRADVSALAGRPVQLRFELRDADLYAFQFRQPPAASAAPASTVRPEVQR
jgi:hypothetical protein